MSESTIPYKIYLEESEMPRFWYNLRADMIKKPAPLLNPGTLRPMTAQELSGVFCDELVKQELDNDTRDLSLNLIAFRKDRFLFFDICFFSCQHLNLSDAQLIVDDAFQDDKLL